MKYPPKISFQKRFEAIQNEPLDAMNLDDLYMQLNFVMFCIRILRDEQEEKRQRLPWQFTDAPGSGAILWERYETLDNMIYVLEDIDFSFDVTEDMDTELERTDKIRKEMKNTLTI